MLECNYESQLGDAWRRDSHHNKCFILESGLDSWKQIRKKTKLFDSTETWKVLAFLLKDISFHQVSYTLTDPIKYFCSHIVVQLWPQISFPNESIPFKFRMFDFRFLGSKDNTFLIIHWPVEVGILASFSEPTRKKKKKTKRYWAGLQKV